MIIKIPVNKNKMTESANITEARLRPALDSIANNVRTYLARHGITTATHPVEVFPCYDLGLVKVIFKGTGVSYTLVPRELNPKSVSKIRPIRVASNYPAAIYNPANHKFVDPVTGTTIGDAYVAVNRLGAESDYSTDLNDLYIKSSDTMIDFNRFVKHIARDSINGNRVLTNGN